MARAREPRIVAELGRPETPDETAERKAANSARYRASKTTRNLAAALVATVAIVVALVAVVVRPDPGLDLSVDWHAIAAQAGEPVVDPELPAGWTANAAEFRGSTDERYWYLGFVTPRSGFVAVEQHDAVDDDLVKHTLPDHSTGPQTQTVGGVAWQAWTAPDAATAGNYARVWETTAGSTQFLVYGTADLDEFTTFVEAVGEDLP
ncbi:DUF4245 family protein [Galbitalea sp. SE-J8]|uniref:DUF4245 family protein n=1 Tax=Galbitalea sp. SE-J8 TaxID=3054952 RepID=UPI00259CA923|nr:DUF4245 family protein [Galbitalea sp. SE-J8]MDM4763388.1 DUF4245 family protein [Galbitalea sp. SE-J8]